MLTGDMRQASQAWYTTRQACITETLKVPHDGIRATHDNYTVILFVVAQAFNEIPWSLPTKRLAFIFLSSVAIACIPSDIELWDTREGLRDGTSWSANSFIGLLKQFLSTREFVKSSYELEM